MGDDEDVGYYGGRNSASTNLQHMNEADFASSQSDQVFTDFVDDTEKESISTHLQMLDNEDGAFQGSVSIFIQFAWLFVPH